MRSLAPALVILAFLTTALSADDYAIGSPFGISALRVYAVSASGEITLHDQTTETTQTPHVAVDSAGRFAVTILGPDDLNVFRIDHARTLSLSASMEEGEYLRYDGDVALSQDGRVVLTLLRNLLDNTFFFRSFWVNNRLDLVWTGGSYSVSLDNLGGLDN